MQIYETAALGYMIAMVALAMLTVLLLINRKSNYQSYSLIVATGISALWATVLALQNLDYLPVPGFSVVFFEWLRNIAWLAALIAVFGTVNQTSLKARIVSPFGAGLILVAAVPVAWYLSNSTDDWSLTAIVAGGYCAALLGMVLAELIYRSAIVSSRSGLNYFCLAIVGLFAYDIVIYVQHIAGVAYGPEWPAARGYISAMLSVPLGFGIWRIFRYSFNDQIPRQLVLHTATLVIVGLAIFLTISGQNYIRLNGGDWGEVGSVVVSVGVILFALVLAASPSIRARFRVSLMKTFFAYKYDYRKEWLRFISTLSATAAEKVPTTAVRAVAQIVNSPGGAVWVQEENSNTYLPIGSWNYEFAGEKQIENDAALISFLKGRQWVIDTEEMQQHRAHYGGLQLDDVMRAGDRVWLIVPMYLGRRLLGFITLLPPRMIPKLNFEDHDLLRTVGRHVAMHINQAESDRQLAESSQFSAYNRLTAFLMHDLNNLIAQQSLVVKNAERYRYDAEFVDDAIGTIANCVSRMTRLMEQLSGGFKVPGKRRTDLCEVLQSAVTRCQSSQPVPVLQHANNPIEVSADKERLTYVFEHLIRNAQDATDASGEATVEASISANAAWVEIRDTGEGMSPQFIRERLFRPFDSTKGSHTMGIGACQARDYIRSLGGQITVESEVGVGTAFSVRLPLHD